MSSCVSGRNLIDGPESFAEAFNVPHETIHSLAQFAELLTHWQKSINLVSPATLPEMWSRHFADSAQLCTLAPEARLWLDLGSGAGFPGLVVAILKANIVDFRMQLVESNLKKCAFLGEVVRATNAPVDIHAERIEDLAEKAQSLRLDVLSARALAPLPRLLSLAEPFIGEGTRALFLKGRETMSEIEAAKVEWRFDYRLNRSVTAPDAHILDVTHLRRRET